MTGLRAAARLCCVRGWHIIYNILSHGQLINISLPCLCTWLSLNEWSVYFRCSRNGESWPEELALLCGVVVSPPLCVGLCTPCCCIYMLYMQHYWACVFSPWDEPDFVLRVWLGLRCTGILFVVVVLQSFLWHSVHIWNDNVVAAVILVLFVWWMPFQGPFADLMKAQVN